MLIPVAIAFVTVAIFVATLHLGRGPSAPEMSH